MAIRAVLDRWSAKYHIKPSEITSAVDHVSDMLSDLFYEVEEGYRDEIEARLHP